MEKSIVKLQNFLDERLRTKEIVNILEAGCGSAARITFRQKTHMTGIDISQKQLERNEYLDKKILGDLQTYTFEPSSFDVVICFFVLEHLKKPVAALDRMAEALKQDGLLILILPNVFSLKGMVTKYTPHGFHVFFYRIFFKQPNAGKDDSFPFKTYLKFSITPGALKRYARSHGLDVPYFDRFDVGDDPYLFGKGRLSVFYRFFYNTLRLVFKLVSLGKLDKSDFIIVLQKKTNNS